jgi:hypothetical protein
VPVAPPSWATSAIIEAISFPSSPAGPGIPSPEGPAGRFLTRLDGGQTKEIPGGGWPGEEAGGKPSNP